MKVGKTSLACQFPKPLLVAEEIGFNLISGVKAAPVSTWSEFKLLVDQLTAPDTIEEAKKLYSTVVIDTIGGLGALCENYIVNRAGYSDISDFGYGKGHGILEREFKSELDKITKAGYGLVAIAHLDVKTDETEEVEKYTLKASKRIFGVINQIVDILAYLYVDKNGERWMLTREVRNDKLNIVAGSRFSYLDKKIPLSYDALLSAVQEAIDKEAKEGALVSEQSAEELEKEKPVEKKFPSFSELRSEAEKLWAEITKNDTDSDRSGAIKISELAEKVFEEKIRLSEIKPGQEEAFIVLLEEMKKLV